ncbi:ADP-ribosylglycohydrolase family protein [Phormidesmis priestleyi]
MQYALSNRFQATLVGAALGEAWGMETDLHQTSFTQPLPLQTLTQHYLQQLLESRNLEPFEQKLSAPDVTGKMAIALLSVGLFFHEDRLKLWQNLERAIARVQDPQVDQQGVFAVEFAIAEILQERLDPFTLIPQLLTTLEVLDDAKSGPLIQQLCQVQTLLQEQAGLDTALKLRHSEGAISSSYPPGVALAFYCFLSTPDNFRLSLLRAARTHQPVVCGLTGALSGAYNGLNGMPIEWRLAINHTETLSQAGHLLAHWSGVYNPTDCEALTSAVAAPQVIRKFG